MPVLIVGADTPIGLRITEALAARQGEVRAFVSSPTIAADLRQRGVKVALGDVSDGSHIGGAGLNCFSLVFVADAAEDDRERSFAPTVDDVYAVWGTAADEVSPQRVIWVDGKPESRPVLSVEHAYVRSAGRDPRDVAAEVVQLDDAASLS